MSEAYVIKREDGTYKRATSQTPKWTPNLTQAMLYSKGRAKSVVSGMKSRKTPDCWEDPVFDAKAVKVEISEVPE